MLAVTAEFTAKPGKEAEFERAFAEMTEGVRAEERTLVYTLIRRREGEREYVLWELYPDESALEEHRATPWMAVLRGQLDELLEARQVTYGEPVAARWWDR